MLRRLLARRRRERTSAEQARAALLGLRAQQAALRRFEYPGQTYWVDLYRNPPDGD